MKRGQLIFLSTLLKYNEPLNQLQYSDLINWNSENSRPSSYIRSVKISLTICRFPLKKTLFRVFILSKNKKVIRI